MQSKLQAIAAALWQIAEKTGKAGKHLDSELAVACYVKSTSRQLRIGRRNTYPAAREADICRVAFGVPDTAGIKTYVAPKAWHVWEFTWEQRPPSASGYVTDYPTPTTPDLTSQTDARRSPRRAQRRRRQLAHTPRGTHRPRLR